MGSTSCLSSSSNWASSGTPTPEKPCDRDASRVASTARVSSGVRNRPALVAELPHHLYTYHGIGAGGMDTVTESP